MVCFNKLINKVASSYSATAASLDLLITLMNFNLIILKFKLKRKMRGYFILNNINSFIMFRFSCFLTHEMLPF